MNCVACEFAFEKVFCLECLTEVLHFHHTQQKSWQIPELMHEILNDGRLTSHWHSLEDTGRGDLVTDVAYNETQTLARGERDWTL